MGEGRRRGHGGTLTGLQPYLIGLGCSRGDAPCCGLCGLTARGSQCEGVFEGATGARRELPSRSTLSRGDSCGGGGSDRLTAMSGWVMTNTGRCPVLWSARPSALEECEDFFGSDAGRCPAEVHEVLRTRGLGRRRVRRALPYADLRKAFGQRTLRGRIFEDTAGRGGKGVLSATVPLDKGERARAPRGKGVSPYPFLPSSRLLHPYPSSSILIHPVKPYPLLRVLRASA